MYTYKIGVQNATEGIYTNITAHLIKDGTITLFNSDRDAVVIYSLHTLLYINIESMDQEDEQDEE
jgi:hypothetical protein